MKTLPDDFDLLQFYGTENYYTWSALFRNFVLTDGAKYVAETCGAYWLMDAIASHLSSYKKEGFAVATLRKGKKTWQLTLSDGNDNELASQRIDYSDFPLPEIELYVVQQDDLRVIELPGEY